MVDLDASLAQLKEGKEITLLLLLLLLLLTNIILAVDEVMPSLLSKYNNEMEKYEAERKLLLAVSQTSSTSITSY